MKIVLPALRYLSVVSIVLVLALTVTAVSLNLSATRPVYEWAASRILDRDVQIKGPISLRFGASTTLSMNDIAIAGTAEAAPAFASIGSVVVRLATRPLLDGALHFTAFSVADVNLVIDIDEQGQGNWPGYDDEPLAAEEISTTRAPFDLRATDVRVERATVSVADARNNRRGAVVIDALQQTLVKEDFELTSQGSANNLAYKTTLRLDGVASLLDIRDWGVAWSGTLGSTQFQLSTTIPSLDDLIRAEIDATIHADSANEVLHDFALAPINDGPVEVSVSTRQGKNRQLIEVNAQFGELQLVGTADHALATAWDSIHLAIRAAGPSLSHIGALWDKPNLPETPFTVDLQASLEGSEVDVETLQLTSEAITLSLAGKLPAYRSLGTGTLSGTIDVPAMGAFASLLDLPRELQGPLHGTLLLTRDPAGTDVRLTSQSSMLALELSGRLTPGETWSGSTLRFSGSSTQPDRWLGLLMDIPPELPPLAFSGEARIPSPETLEVEKLVVQMEEDTLSAEGLIGWATARQETAITLTAYSQNLRTTLTPWVPSPQVLPELSATAMAQIKYAATDPIQIETATVSAAESLFQFTGDLAFESGAPALRGLWKVSVPRIQPLLPQMNVPQRYERPLSFRGDIAWTPGAISIDVDTNGIQYGSITAEGRVSVDLINRKGQFDVLASTPDVRDYLPSDAHGAHPSKLPMNLNAIGEWDEAVLRGETLQVESPDIQINAAGLLELSSQEFTRSHLDADININRLTVLHDWVDFPFPDQGLALTADFDSQGGALVINALTLRSGDSDLAVRGKIERSPDIQMKLDIRSARVNIDPWIAAVREGHDNDGEQSGSVTSEQRVLPDYPIPTDWFDYFSANADLTIREFVGLPRPVFNVQGVLITGADGLRINNLSAENQRGGGASLRGSLVKGSDAIPQLEVAIEGFDLVMGIPKAPSEEIDSLPSYEFKTKISGAGSTTGELATDLEGYLSAVMGSGKVLNAGFDRWTNSVVLELSQVLNPLQDQRDVTKINCAAAFVTIESGTLVGKPAIVLDTPDVKISSNITLDLASERIKAKFKTVPQKGLGFSVSSVFNPYVEVTGTLAKPQITVDPANTVVGGSLAVITGGLSILAQNVVDRMKTSGNVCAERLNEANAEIATRDSQN